MKAIKLSLVALTIALGTFAAFAFSPEKTEAKTTFTSYHWFDAITGNPLGEKTLEQQQTMCGAPGNIDCAYGYSSLDPNGNPVGTPVVVKRQ